MKKIGLWVAAVFTNQLKLNSHLHHVVKTQLYSSICSRCCGQWVAVGRAPGGARDWRPQALQHFSDAGQAVQYVQQHH